MNPNENCITYKAHSGKDVLVSLKWLIDNYKITIVGDKVSMISFEGDKNIQTVKEYLSEIVHYINSERDKKDE